MQVRAPQISRAAHDDRFGWQQIRETQCDSLSDAIPRLRSAELNGILTHVSRESTHLNHVQTHRVQFEVEQVVRRNNNELNERTRVYER